MTPRDSNDAFFYEDMSPEDRPFCPPLRHDDDPEPFFRGGGQELFLIDGQIVDHAGKQTYWLTHCLLPESERRETFSDPWEAALALLLNDDAWFLGRCYLKFDYRECLCRPITAH